MKNNDYRKELMTEYPIPGSTPPPSERSKPRRIANVDEATIMEIAQELVHGETEENEYMARLLWSDLGLYNMQGFDVYSGNFLDLVFSQLVVWIAESDDRTCKTCEERQGQTYALRDLPETHPNCRCGLNLAQEGLVDVTEIVMKELREKAIEAFEHTLNLFWFKEQVDNNAQWDIKRQVPWTNTLKIPYPDGKVIFESKIRTPEWLGNFTYGYLGLATGICDNLLNYGSIFVALSNFKGKDAKGIIKEILNEIKDQISTDVGERKFISDITNGVYNDYLVEILKVIFTTKTQEKFVPLL